MLILLGLSRLINIININLMFLISKYLILCWDVWVCICKIGVCLFIKWKIKNKYNNSD